MSPREAEDRMLRQRIGARVYRMRKQQKMTALLLAERAKLHRNTIYRIEAGMSLCSIGQVYRIAQVLGVPMEAFLRPSELNECTKDGSLRLTRTKTLLESPSEQGAKQGALFPPPSSTAAPRSEAAAKVSRSPSSLSPQGHAARPTHGKRPKARKS